MKWAYDCHLPTFRNTIILDNRKGKNGFIKEKNGHIISLKKLSLFHQYVWITTKFGHFWISRQPVLCWKWCTWHLYFFYNTSPKEFEYISFYEGYYLKPILRFYILSKLLYTDQPSNYLPKKVHVLIWSVKEPWRELPLNWTSISCTWYVIPWFQQKFS